jgi:hypothetical protein
MVISDLGWIYEHRQPTVERDFGRGQAHKINANLRMFVSPPMRKLKLQHQQLNLEGSSKTITCTIVTLRLPGEDF